MFLQENEAMLHNEGVHSDFDTSLGLQDLSEAMLEATTAFHALERQAMLEQYSVEKEYGFLTESVLNEAEEGEEKEGLKAKLKDKAGKVGTVAKNFGAGVMKVINALWDKISSVFEKVFTKLGMVFRNDTKFIEAKKAKIALFDGSIKVNVHAGSLDPKKVYDNIQKEAQDARKDVLTIAAGNSDAVSNSYISVDGNKVKVDSKGLKAQVRAAVIGKVGPATLKKGEVQKVLSGFTVLASKGSNLSQAIKSVQKTAADAKKAFAKKATSDGKDAATKGIVSLNNAAAEVIRSTLGEVAASMNVCRAECRGILSKAAKGGKSGGAGDADPNKGEAKDVKNESAELDLEESFF